MFNWLKNLFGYTDKEEEKAQIWAIMEGAKLAEDIDPKELIGLDVPDNATRLILKIAIGSEVFDAEAWFEDYEDAKPIIDHFNKSIEPLTMNLNEYTPYE